MLKFQRSRGLTASETVLADLCDRSFLSLWSYPNLFRAPGKELADLLVVFGNDVIIFSDKSCEYKRTENANVDWKRWYKKSIFKSAHQVFRTEKWIRNHPDKIFLDSSATTALPIVLPTPTSAIRFYRVCVVSGGPPLRLEPKLNGDGLEGSIGCVDKNEGWVHVIDGQNLKELLTELSTVGDFIDYLGKKEAAIKQGRLLFASNELDVVAYFIHAGRQFPPSPNSITLAPHLWEELIAKPEYQRRLQDDQKSYLWDSRIEKLTAGFVSSELEFGNDIPVPDFEAKARLMARERRFSRRFLVKWIEERRELSRLKRTKFGSAIQSPTSDDLVYVLLVDTGSSREEHAEYRKGRLAELYARCYAAKCEYPERRYFLGMAMDESHGRGGSEDYILIDTGDWGAAEMEDAQKARQILGHPFTENALA